MSEVKRFKACESVWVDGYYVIVVIYANRFIPLSDLAM